jgi:hypothetical protein
MPTDTEARLRRELLLLRAVELLMGGEIARLSRQEARREHDEWDAGDAAAATETAIAVVAEMRQHLVAARREAAGELEEAETAAARTATGNQVPAAGR